MLSQAAQRQVDIIPLNCEVDYKPDGWLGLILGANLWFEFSNDMSERAFERALASLTAELGPRGRDAIGAATAAGGGEPEPGPPQGVVGIPLGTPGPERGADVGSEELGRGQGDVGAHSPRPATTGAGPLAEHSYALLP